MSDILSPEEWRDCTDLTPRRPDADFERRWALLRAHDAALRAALEYETQSADHHMRLAGHLGEELRAVEARLAEATELLHRAQRLVAGSRLYDDIRAWLEERDA